MFQAECNRRSGRLSTLPHKWPGKGRQDARPGVRNPAAATPYKMPAGNTESQPSHPPDIQATGSWQYGPGEEIPDYCSAVSPYAIRTLRFVPKKSLSS
jgi:hypothetical protein